jgi:DNA-binding winged helix-turn-helix (wHTH) protein/Tol biopolymer transport system component
MPVLYFESLKDKGVSLQKLTQSARVFCFGVFEVDAATGELRKQGVRIRLQGQPAQILLMLLNRAGEVVSREEICRQLWPPDTFVDFDQGLGTALRKLRQALCDDAETPRYIETIPKQGFRFVAAVERILATPKGAYTGLPVLVAEPPAPKIQQEPHTIRSIPSLTPSVNRLSTRRLWWGTAAVGLLTLAFFWWRSSPGEPTIGGVTQLTDDGNPRQLESPLISDGSRIYFNEFLGSSQVLAQVSATGGQTGTLASGIQAPMLADLAPDSSSLLVYAPKLDFYAPKVNWFLLPLPAGEPRKVPGFEGFWGVRFSPGGNFLLSKGRSLYVSEKDTSNARKLFDFQKIVTGFVVSPDGKKIRVNLRSNTSRRSLWEINSDGSNPHPLLPGWQSEGDTCCGRWTADGKHFVFQSRLQGRADLWVLREGDRWFGRAPSPQRLTNGPLSYEQPFPSRDGKHIYALGMKKSGELVRYDSKSRQFVPYLSRISATDVTVSNDGKWIAYLSYPGHNLWRVRADGSERLQLTYPPASVYYPRISPDGTAVSYADGNTGSVYIVQMTGGNTRKIEDRGFAALWSPDGNSVVVSIFDSTNEGLGALETIDLQTGKISPVPDSAGKAGANWPLQDLLVAPAQWNGVPSFVTFDFKTRKWTHLVSGSFTHWILSVDRKYLYYTTGGDDPEVMRVRFSDGKVEEIASLKNFRSVEEEGVGSWVGVTADGDPLLTRDVGTQEIYDLSVHWP